jgi:hypothetical protein
MLDITILAILLTRPVSRELEKKALAKVCASRRKIRELRQKA